MATIPLSATNVRFMSNVPFTNDYKDVRYFDNISQQLEYFSNRTTVHSMTQCSFQRNDKINYIKANASINKLYFTNYVSFQNPEFSNKTFYAFVTKLEYVNNNLTNVYFELDVFQTWKFDVSFKQSFVEREHTRMFDANGNPLVNTLDEGLAYGSDYVTVSDQVIMPSIWQYLVIITNKQIAVRDDNINSPIARTKRYVGSPTALFYYILPYRRDTQGVPSFDGVQLVNLDLLTALISEDTNIVNTIQGMYFTDYIGILFNETNPNNIPLTDSVRPRLERVKVITDDKGEFRLLYVKSTDTFEEKRIFPSGKVYDSYTRSSEGKLFMYPYTLTEIDDFKGNRLTLKNEFINSSELNIRVKGSIGDSNKISYEVLRYLNTGDSQASYQNSIIDNSPNTVPIVTDYGAAMMQGSRNSLQTRKDNAQKEAFSNIYSGVATGVSQWYNPLGAVASGTDTIQKGATKFYSEVANINAKLQDAVNVPPSVSNMGGNSSFENGNGFQGIRIIKKEITQENRNRLENFFNMFGYKVSQTKVPNLHTRRHWNYVKTLGVTITSRINNEDLQEFKNIFDNGVTLWHNDDIGDYSKVNEVI